MRARLTVLLLLAAVAAGCATGPNYVSNSARDWHNNNYEESPLLTGVLTDVVPFYPIVFLGASIPDWLVINPVQWWGFDIWRGKGAAYVHDNPSPQHMPWIFKEKKRR